jgi:hypothetical protein
MLNLVEVDPIVDDLRSTAHKTVNLPIGIYCKSLGSYIELANEKFNITQLIWRTVQNAN